MIRGKSIWHFFPLISFHFIENYDNGDDDDDNWIFDDVGDWFENSKLILCNFPIIIITGSGTTTRYHPISPFKEALEFDLMSAMSSCQ